MGKKSRRTEHSTTGKQSALVSLNCARYAIGLVSKDVVVPEDNVLPIHNIDRISNCVKLRWERNSEEPSILQQA